MMQTLRRYRNVFVLIFTLVFILCSLLLGGWISSQFFQAPRTARPLSSLTSGAPSRTSGTSGSTASPTVDQPSEHLVIPTIGVNASIESVGVLADGNMAVPTQKPWDGVGWYKYGPHPGEQGSAVIDGHLDRRGGAPAVFWKLGSLHIGDIVMVVSTGEKTLHFRIVNMQYYAPNNAPLKAIFENRTGIFLNLITCAGRWIPNQHQTTLRLVIYTILM